METRLLGMENIKLVLLMIKVFHTQISVEIVQCSDRQYQTRAFICLFKNGSVILKINRCTSLRKKPNIHVFNDCSGTIRLLTVCFWWLE